jgi:hypothetical protein
VTLEISRAECNIDVTPGTLTATDTCIGYHVTRFEASRKVMLHTRYVCACVGAGGGRGRGTKINTNVILHTCYVSTFVWAGGGRGRGTKIKTKANRCGACYLTCDMYKSSLRHIHNPVLSSLKMKGIRLLFWPNPSSNTMKGNSTRGISWEGKGGRRVRLTTLPSSCADCL